MPKRRSTATIRRHRQTHVRKLRSHRRIQGGKYGRRRTRRARGGGITGTICGRRLELSSITGTTAMQCIANAKKQINDELAKEIKDLENQQSTIEKAKLRMYECTSDTNLVKDITESPNVTSEKTYRITDESPTKVNVKIQGQLPKTEYYFLRESTGYSASSKLFNLKMDIRNTHNISADEIKKYELFHCGSIVKSPNDIASLQQCTFQIPPIQVVKYNAEANTVQLANDVKNFTLSPGNVFTGLPNDPNDLATHSSVLGLPIGHRWSNTTLGVIIRCTDTTLTYAYERAHCIKSEQNRSTNESKLDIPKFYVCQDVDISKLEFDKLEASNDCFYGYLNLKINQSWPTVVWYYDPPTRSFGFGIQTNYFARHPYATKTEVQTALNYQYTSVTISNVTDIADRGYHYKPYRFDIVDTNQTTHSFYAESQAQKDYCLRLFAIVKQLQPPSS